MQLEQEVIQENLNRYVGGEVVVEHNGVLTNGTATSLVLQGDLLVVGLKDTSWKNGTLDSVDAGIWSDTAPGSTSVLLSTSIESANGDVLYLAPSLRETKARLSPRVR